MGATGWKTLAQRSLPKLAFSDHARRRMRERAIPEAAVREVLALGHVACSRQTPDARFYHGGLIVVFGIGPEGARVVTTFWDVPLEREDDAA